MKNFFHFCLKSFSFLISATALLSSCVTLNSLPSHNVPTFTDKNQVEGSVSLGASGLNANLAYSPIKYLSVQVNGFSSMSCQTEQMLPPSNLQHKVFNNQIEGGIGFYCPEKYFIYGANLGYGQGAVSWERWYRPDSGDRSPFLYEKFDTKWKAYINTFFAYKMNKESFSGLSVKYSVFNNYYYVSTIGSDYVGEQDYYKDQTVRGTSLSITHFMKTKLTKHLYFIHDEGFSFTTDAPPAGIIRAGFMLKF